MHIQHTAGYEHPDVDGETVRQQKGTHSPWRKLDAGSWREAGQQVSSLATGPTRFIHLTLGTLHQVITD